MVIAHTTYARMITLKKNNYDNNELNIKGFDNRFVNKPIGFLSFCYLYSGRLDNAIV